MYHLGTKILPCRLLGVIVTEIFAKNLYFFRGVSGFWLMVDEWGVASKKGNKPVLTD